MKVKYLQWKYIYLYLERSLHSTPFVWPHWNMLTIARRCIYFQIVKLHSTSPHPTQQNYRMCARIVERVNRHNKPLNKQQIVKNPFCSARKHTHSNGTKRMHNNFFPLHICILNKSTYTRESGDDIDAGIQESNCALYRCIDSSAWNSRVRGHQTKSVKFHIIGLMYWMCRWWLESNVCVWMWTLCSGICVHSIIHKCKHKPIIANKRQTEAQIMTNALAQPKNEDQEKIENIY